jgi:predicted ArsR family transcriptional regulator
MSKDSNKGASPAPAKAQSKKDKLLALLRADGGASISEITDATNWQPHSARAVLTGLRKKGFTLDKAKVEGVTHYSIAGQPSA